VIIAPESPPPDSPESESLFRLRTHARRCSERGARWRREKVLGGVSGRIFDGQQCSGCSLPLTPWRPSLVVGEQQPLLGRYGILRTVSSHST
jgi:hypothetical protein